MPASENPNARLTSLDLAYKHRGTLKCFEWGSFVMKMWFHKEPSARRFEKVKLRSKETGISTIIHLTDTILGTYGRPWIKHHENQLGTACKEWGLEYEDRER